MVVDPRNKMDPGNKIVSRETAADLGCQAREQGKVVGFTSGVFDLLHVGHVDYLSQASQQCDVLFVAVNSDSSVRQNKGQERPIVREQQRAEVIAALGMVDHVFLFDERRNSVNIELLRPDVYMKAGDYERSQLTSRDLVESYGGRVQLIPLQHTTSTTQIVQRIRQVSNDAGAQGEIQLDLPPKPPQPAVFLDRDGTINREVEYLHDPEQFEFLPNAVEGLSKLTEAGFRIVVVTNQAGIGLGYFTKEDFYRVNRAMFQGLTSSNVIIDRIYFCPHSLREDCPCRKPRTGLVEQAATDLNLNLSLSYFVGDKSSDILCGKRVGMSTIRVTTGHGERSEIEPDYIASDLVDAAHQILAHAGKKKAVVTQ